jgi:subtilisin
MKSRFIAAFLAFSVLAAPLSASAATTSSATVGRYFVQTTKSFWRNALNARNVFDTGFTADLSDFQFRLAKLTGLKPIPLKKFTVLDDAAATATPTPQAAPANSISWGIGYLLGQQLNDQTTGGKGIRVAVLDTGIDPTHPDLERRIAKCANYADPEKAFIDDECTDTNGHGTHVAGIIAADGGPEGKGIWGMAPEAELLVYQVCNGEGQCLSDDIAKAIEGAVNDEADIIVLGMGGESESSFIDDALAYAQEHDVLVIAAAGNNGPYEDSVDWPAHNPSVVAVGALASDGTVAEFSSRGGIELVAPGENIESTFREGSYAILSGTSMAAPHVAGLAARIWKGESEHPAQAVRELLHDMAQDIGPVGKDSVSGWGVPRF